MPPGHLMNSSAKASGIQKVSRRSAEIKPFKVMEVLRAAAELESRSSSTSPKVIHLEIGQPSAGPPAHVTEGAISALRLPAAQQGYTSAAGLPELRSAIASLYAKRNSIIISPQHVLVTSGSSGAFVALFATLFDPGDRVAVAVPGYPCYRNVLRALSITVVELPVSAATNYQPTLEQLQGAHEAAALSGVIVASPSNPTGSVLSAARLSELVAWAHETRLRLVMDEIYHGIARTPVASAAQFEDVIVVNSFSKYWCLPGFRVGWAVVRCAAIRTGMENALQNMQICAAGLSQRAALAALDDRCESELDGHVRRYLAVADGLVQRLREAGFEEVDKPDGAFYVYVGCSAVCRRLGVQGATGLCRLLLEKTRVAVTPGTDFDPERGEKFVRFSCAGSSEDVEEGARRIVEFVGRTE